jgi:hypothetical protein
MQVRIKSLNINMPVKQSGIEFEVHNPDGRHHRGDCYLTMTGITWCPGRTGKANGISLRWEELETILASSAAKRAALVAAHSA